MTLIKFAISSAFITGALTAGAFLTGTLVGNCLKKAEIVPKLKKLTIKKNQSASTKKLKIRIFSLNKFIKGDNYEKNNIFIWYFCISFDF